MSPRPGFKAMMKGEGDVVSGWQNKLQSAIANVTPASDTLAEHAPQTSAQPGMQLSGGGASHEGALLARQGRHPLRDGARSEDRASARRHHQGDRLRHLRLRPAYLRRRHSRACRAATCSATRPWARWSRSAREDKKLKVGDRVVVPFTISCGECFFCKRGFYSGCERSNPEHGEGREAVGPFARRPVRLLASARRLSRRPGRISARALRRCRPDQGAGRAQRRAGAVPVRHLPDRLHGAPSSATSKAATRSRSGAAARSGSSRSAAPSCSAPSA